MLHSALPFWALPVGGRRRFMYKSDWDRVPALCSNHLMGRQKTEQMLLVQCQRVLLEIWEGVLGSGREQSQNPRDGIWPKPWGTRKKPTPWRAHIPCMVFWDWGQPAHSSTKVCFFHLQRKSNPFYKYFLHNASPSSGSVYQSIFLSYYNVPGIILSILRVSFLINSCNNLPMKRLLILLFYWWRKSRIQEHSLSKVTEKLESQKTSTAAWSRSQSCKVQCLDQESTN